MSGRSPFNGCRKITGIHLWPYFTLRNLKCRLTIAYPSVKVYKQALVLQLLRQWLLKNNKHTLWDEINRFVLKNVWLCYKRRVFCSSRSSYLLIIGLLRTLLPWTGEITFDELTVQDRKRINQWSLVQIHITNERGSLLYVFPYCAGKSNSYF